MMYFTSINADKISQLKNNLYFVCVSRKLYTTPSIFDFFLEFEAQHSLVNYMKFFCLTNQF